MPRFYLGSGRRPRASDHHFIRRVDAEDRPPRDGACANGVRCPNRHATLGGPVVYFASYSAVTGRKGRVTLRELWLCEDCGKRFAERYNRRLPATTRPTP